MILCFHRWFNIFNQIVANTGSTLVSTSSSRWYKEVGTALGMTSRQLRRQIEIPLALPYVLNGIKLAIVEIIASATLATYIGAGGLGTLIFTGLGLYDMTYIVIGAVSVAALSLGAMLGFDFLIRKVRKHDKSSYSI